MSDTHMTENLWAKCPDCWWGDELSISIHDPAKTFVFECSNCGRVSRLRVSTAIARWADVEEANYRDHMWYSAR